MNTRTGGDVYGECENAARVIQDSVTFAFVNGVVRGYLAGAQHSPIAARVRRAIHAFAMLSPALRVRSIALTAAVAATAHPLMVGLVPPGSAPRLPRSLDLVVATLALAVVFGVRPLVMASTSSLVLRRLRSRHSIGHELTREASTASDTERRHP